ncbi:unnamed protein product [Wuchereria bancrofti]|uniref:Uncharacterized protein n=1 Tax=Wuchereria bancrofti TaxID=6293 RepID=A0A3P7EA75_WUCBA|nr:unnamed protein product [Wuchereria bancrofti]
MKKLYPCIDICANRMSSIGVTIPRQLTITVMIFIEKENHSAIFAIFRYTNSAVHRVPITYLVLLALITVNIDITEVYVQDIHLSLRNMNFKNLRLGKLGLINRSVPIIVT